MSAFWLGNFNEQTQITAAGKEKSQTQHCSARNFPLVIFSNWQGIFANACNEAVVPPHCHVASPPVRKPLHNAVSLRLATLNPIPKTLAATKRGTMLS